MSTALAKAGGKADAESKSIGNSQCQAMACKSDGIASAHSNGLAVLAGD
jgi:hypothetical protein